MFLSKFLRLVFFRSSNIIYRSISHFLLTFLIFILMNIFVAKLNYDTDEDTLRGSFEEYGAVDSAKVVMDKFTGRSKGFGFVEMPDDSEAMAAINGLNDTEIDGRTIVVKKAEPKAEGGSRDGFRGGDRRGGGGGFRNGGDRRY